MHEFICHINYELAKSVSDRKKSIHLQPVCPAQCSFEGQSNALGTDDHKLSLLSRYLYFPFATKFKN